jgi:hypothetical protein
MIKTYKYANCGKVATKFQKSRPRDTVASPKPAGTIDTLRNQRARQMKAMGLRDGGPVKMPPKETRKIPPTQLPAPQPGTKPKRIGKKR